MTRPTASRHFASDAAVRRIGNLFMARTLPRAEWTHEAHLATCLWLLVERPDIDVDAALGTLIAAYNESVGGVNDDTQGFHATITHAYLQGVRAFLAGGAGRGLSASVNAVLDGPVGARDWPLRFWSRGTLFSVAARRAVVPPDIAPLPIVIESA